MKAKLAIIKWHFIPLRQIHVCKGTDSIYKWIDFYRALLFKRILKAIGTPSFVLVAPVFH